MFQKTLLFFPPNITNEHQPANIGLIAFINFGYRFIILTRLLAIFDAKGLDYGDKAHVLGTMHILKGF